MKKFDFAKIKYLALVFWFFFTLALAGWLYYFFFNQTSRLSELGPAETLEVLRYHRMLMWEGTFLFASILGGGLVLTYYILRDVQQSKRIRAFFLTFSHELKTPLASLQLQAECLRDDLGTRSSPILERLISDANRLSIQLENSLYLAEAENRELFLEDISLKDVVESLSHSWTNIQLAVGRNALIRGDRRAIESILKNLVHNSVTHGKADCVQFDCGEAREGFVRLVVSDNGGGYLGDPQILGKLFSRPLGGSGNGIGLYLCFKLLSMMNGSVERIEGHPKFRVTMIVPGRLL